MPLLVGTADGVYRAGDVPFDGVERVLDTGKAPRVRSFEAVDGVFAATMGGLFRSTDGGRSWDDLGAPTTRVWDVFAGSDGRLYAGCQPAHLYVSTDVGRTWTELDSLRDHPTVDRWRCAYGPDAHVRTVAAHPETPERLFVGVEAGGLYRSDDGGETWGKCALTDGSVPVQDDVHQVVPVTPEEYVAVCGRLSIHDRNHAAAEGGLYLTMDAGSTWSRTDADLVPSYFKTVLVRGGTLYACGTTTVPPEWPTLGAEATMFASLDGGETFEEMPYPGGPAEVVLAWAVDDDRVFGGTAAGDRGRVIVLDSGREWRTVGFVPDDVHAVHAV